MQIVPKARNPLRMGTGLGSAWFLFMQLDKPFNDFEKFRDLIRQCIKRDTRLYYRKTEDKPNGGKRVLDVPCRDLMIVQDLINKKILQDRHERHPNTFGFSGGSVREAMERIAKSNQDCFSVDLVGAFPSTTAYAVHNYFRQAKFGVYSSYYLTCLTTWIRNIDDHDSGFVLPQGAPTSPRLFDICFRYFDDKFQQMAERNNGVYVRYADNLFFTCPDFWLERQAERQVKVACDHNCEKCWRWTYSEWEELFEFSRPQSCYETKMVRLGGKDNYEKNSQGATLFHSPYISAIFSILNQGYLFDYKPLSKKELSYKAKYDYSHKQAYRLHKAYLCKKEKLLYALGLNRVDNEIRNTRRFKNKLRMTIYNLDKSLSAKDDFEKVVWPLYLRLRGLMQFVVRETLPEKYLADWERLELRVESIRYSGGSGTWVQNPSY